MITAVLKGGLGNQLFQISATINLAVENKAPFAFDARTWGTRGGAASTFQARNPHSYKETIYQKLPFKLLSYPNFIAYNEPHFHYKKIEFKSNMILNGYFQSEKYFTNSEDIIRKVFAIQGYKNKFGEKYGVDPRDAVSVHVRRGEYLKDSIHHPPCTAEYFVEAMKEFPDKKFLFISDDIEWCKQNFIGDKYMFSKNDTDIQDFYDLSCCENNIISNSTFSWWGAWLNNNESKKVIAPKIWFGPGHSNLDTRDLLPEKWIAL